MIDVTKFKPKTVYITYIDATPEAVFQALTTPGFTKQYFGAANCSTGCARRTARR